MPRNARLPLEGGEVDLLREVVRRGATETSLTTREAALLAYLAGRSGEAVSRDELRTRVWGYSDQSLSRTVDTTVHRLRAKIERDPTLPVHLITVTGHGYRFVAAEDGPGALVGRDADLQRLRDALERHAMVGVVGSPGVGKTRLVRALDGAVHVGASPDLLHGIAIAAGLALDRGDPFERVAALLRTRRAPWVLDWLDRGQAVLVERLSAAAPGSRIVVVTRERLPLAGAAWIEVAPLSARDATRLFVARARDADPSFAAADDVVDAIVARLDGLPLALELAAGRTHVLSPEALRDRLADPLRVLGDGLGRALAEVWDALPPSRRTALARCAVFRASFPLEAAEAVLAGEEPVVDVLADLRDRSLLVAVRDEGELRFQLLHVVRAFARRHLGDDEDAVLRHRAWHLAEARRLAALLDGPSAPDALRRLRSLRADLAALDDPLALDALLEVDGPATERLARLERAPAEPDVLRRRADALRAAGRTEDARRVATSAGRAPRALVSLAFVDPEHAVAHATEALRAADPATAVLAWLAIAGAARRRGDTSEAERALRRALERVRGDGVVRYEPAVTSNLANLRREAGHPEEAERLYLAAVRACRALGLVRIEAAALHNLGGLLAEKGDGAALEVVDRALAAARSCGEIAVVAHASHALGHLLHREGRLDEAEERYVEAVGLLRGIDPAVAASALGDLGALQADRGLLAEAERTLDEAAAGVGDDPGRRAVLLVHRAHLLLARGQAAAARALVAEAEALDAGRCRMAIQLVRIRTEER